MIDAERAGSIQMDKSTLKNTLRPTGKRPEVTVEPYQSTMCKY